MPGWILNETWMNDEGVPRSGFLDIKYNTDIGRRAQSVSPNIPFRKSLCCLVGSVTQSPNVDTDRNAEFFLFLFLISFVSSFRS